MKPTHTVNDALRMAGQLLLACPTTGALARTSYGQPVEVFDEEACNFCYLGALHVTCYRLKVPYMNVRKTAKDLTGIDWGYKWDSAGADRQMEIARKLASVTDP